MINNIWGNYFSQFYNNHIGIKRDGFVGLLDGVSNTALAAYSVARRLTRNYRGPLVRLRRSSDNSEQDFYATPFGILDTSAIDSFATSGLFVTKLYDQIGTEHLSNSTADNQPTFSKTSVNNKPGITFDGSNDRLIGNAVGTLPLVSSGMSIFFVAKNLNTNARYFLDFEDTTHSIISNYVAGKWEWYSSPRTQFGDTSTSVFQALSWQNGNTPNAITTVTLGGNEDFGDWYNGIVPEVIIWQTALDTAKQTEVLSNMRSFYNI